MSMNDYLLSLVREKTNEKDIVQTKVNPSPMPEQTSTTPLTQVTYPETPYPYWNSNPDGGFSLPEEVMFPQEEILPVEQQPVLPEEPEAVITSPKPIASPKSLVDNYLLYGGKCQYKKISPENIMCLADAKKKIAVAVNMTGEIPADEDFQDLYLCVDHLSEISHRSGFFVK